ncbi:hypothetical protein [Neptuniibacter sp. QD37_11]|uniref:hypothetical protein n=1 Tax=Neptuniibacter sp. QD37_11 TaxID=3398209 RepID=UPI0039F64897
MPRYLIAEDDCLYSLSELNESVLTMADHGLISLYDRKTNQQYQGDGGWTDIIPAYSDKCDS